MTIECLRGTDYHADLKAGRDDAQSVKTWLTELMSRYPKDPHRAVCRVWADLQRYERDSAYTNGVFETCPITLLHGVSMGCGQVAGVGLALFANLGVRGRFVFFCGHTAAELEYDGMWHYFDPWACARPPMMGNRIATVEEICADWQLLLPHWRGIPVSHQIRHIVSKRKIDPVS